VQAEANLKEAEQLLNERKAATLQTLHKTTSVARLIMLDKLCTYLELHHRYFAKGFAQVSGMLKDIQDGREYISQVRFFERDWGRFFVSLASSTAI
jgi:hypothetical protein